MTNGQQKPLWSVVTQRHITDVDSAGNLEDVMEVYARTASGIDYSVKVPWSQYDPTTVAQALEARAQAIETVQAL